MNILKQLKLAALNQVAKSQTPSSLERCILAERIAARLVPQGNHIKLDHDATERFARTCIDEAIRLMQKHVGDERERLLEPGD